MTLSRKLRMACLTLLLVCTVGCDQTSKHIARTQLSQTGPIALSGGLVQLRLAENPGSFLGLGALLPNPARLTVFTLGAGIGMVWLAGYLVSRPRIDLWRFVGLAMILARGISNLLDRLLRHGLVTNFMAIRFGPVHTGVFNAADCLIMLGACVIIYAFRNRRSPDGPITQTERSGR